MPLYYFHIHRQGHVIQDQEGMELENVAAAKEEAFASARELAIHVLKESRAKSGDSIQVTDGAGKSVLTVPVRSVVS